MPEEGVLAANGHDRLSRDIKNFLGRTENIRVEPERTENVPESWRTNGGRSASVSRDDFESSLRSTSMAAPPPRNSIHFRASSVAPVLYGRDPIPQNGSRYTNGRELSPQNFSSRNNGRELSPQNFGSRNNGRELSPLNFSYRKNGRLDPDYDFSYRDAVSVTRSVTGRAAELPLVSAGFSSKAGQRSKFMTLEEECNWILSGREPPPANDGDENGDDSDGEDDTLDDISGDEVQNTI